MAAVVGRNMLLKIGTGTAATTVAGLRPTSFTVNGETVDVTSKDSGGYRELLGSAGVVSVSMTANGIMAGGTQDLAFINRIVARSLDLYTMTFGTNTLAGSFQVTSYSATGDYNNAQTFDLGLESSGSLTFA